MKKFLVSMGVMLTFLLGVLVAPTATATQPSWNNGDTFWTILTRVEPGYAFGGYSKKDAISLAKQVCKKMRKAKDVRDMRDILYISGLPDDGSSFLRIGVASFCPSKSKWLDQYPTGSLG